MGPASWQGREAILTTGVNLKHLQRPADTMNEETESGVRKARAEAQ